MTRLLGNVAFRLALGTAHGLLDVRDFCGVPFGTRRGCWHGVRTGKSYQSRNDWLNILSRGGEGLRQEVQQLLTEGSTFALTAVVLKQS